MKFIENLILAYIGKPLDSNLEKLLKQEIKYLSESELLNLREKYDFKDLKILIDREINSRSIK